MFKKWMTISTLMIALGSAMTGFADYYGNSETDGFFIDADYLLWQVKEDGLEYLKVTTGVPNPPPPLPGLFTEPLGTVNERPHFRKWSSGFRVGVGYEDKCSNWYTSLNYTYFRNRSSGNFSGIPVDGFGFLLNTRGIVPSEYDTLIASTFNANAIWRLNYNILDWEIGTTYVNRDFKFSPFIGLRGAIIDQKFENDITVAGGFFGPLFETPILGAGQIEVAKNNYHAAGLRTGVDIEWNWAGGLGLYAKVSGSLLYGKFSIDDAFVKAAILGTIDDPTLAGVTNSIRERYTRLKANLEGAIGIQYEMDNLRVRLGFELIEWFDQNQLPGRILRNNMSASDLEIHGLQLSASYDF